MVRSLKGSGRQGRVALLVLASHNFSAGAAVQRTSVHTVCMAGHTDGWLDFCINKCFLCQLTAVIALAWPGLRVLTHAERSVNVITNVYVTNTVYVHSTYIFHYIEAAVGVNLSWDLILNP